MKICFTIKKPKTSSGGGCFYVQYLAEYFQSKGLNITYNLEKNIDFIFMVDPRKNLTNMYDINTLINYRKKNPNTKIIYPVNECDIKRQKTINLEPIIIYSMENCNIILFISNWLKNYYKTLNNRKKKKIISDKLLERIEEAPVINNCCDLNIFYPLKTKELDISDKLLERIEEDPVINNCCDLNIVYPLKTKELDKKKIKIVTHHWSNDYNKGFEIYNKLDELLEKCNNLEFTYIGRYNKTYKPKNIKLINPKMTYNLAEELRKHDIYLTASLYEPGGLHQLEGMACGLPILYRTNGGGIKETINGAGEEFTDLNEMFKKMIKIIKNYKSYVNNINYKFISRDRCGKEYLELINNNLELNNEILENEQVKDKQIIKENKWILGCIEWMKKIEEIDYQWSLSGNNNAKLASIGLFCKLITIFKNHHSFNKIKIKNLIKSYKNGDNYYIDNTKRDNIISDTRQTISGLINLSINHDVPNLINYYNPNDLYFMNDKRWDNPWDAGAQLSHYLFFLNMKKNILAIDKVLNQLKKYEKNDGWYNKKPSDHVRINGIMKIMSGYEAINRQISINIIKKILNSMLIQNPESGGCNMYDYVYVLTYCLDYSYREQEIKNKLKNIYKSILKYQQLDGGFSYSKNKSQEKYGGKKITNGKKQGDIHGTTLMCMAIARINKYCDLGLNLILPIS